MTTLILISLLALITIGVVLFIYKSSRSEYISDEDKRTLGDYVIYFNTCDRVSSALECLMEKDGLCESEDAE
jgi:hypothetical protein